MKKRTLTALVVAGCIAPAWPQEMKLFRIVEPVPAAITDLAADGTITWTNRATNATFTVQTAIALREQSGWADYVQVPASNSMTVHQVFDLNPPAGMVLIPAGSFTMGEAIDLNGAALPLHTVRGQPGQPDQVLTNDTLGRHCHPLRLGVGSKKSRATALGRLQAAAFSSRRRQ